MIVQEGKEEKLKSTDRVMMHSDEVDFTIKYPKEYNKANGQPMPKYFKDGDVVRIHRLQGEDWKKRGIGDFKDVK